MTLLANRRVWDGRVHPKARKSRSGLCCFGCFRIHFSRCKSRVIIFVEPEEADALKEELQTLFGARLEITRSHALIVEGNPLGVSKGDALRRLAEYMHVPQSQVMAVGDQDNDIPMLEWAGIGVAMGNASPGLKAIADWIAPPLQEDGAAVALERFVLKSALNQPVRLPPE